MKRFLKYLIGSTAVVLLVTAYSAGTKATGVTSSSSKYIEVCSRRIAYVPPGTDYVTCRGIVMKVIAIVPLEGGVQTEGGCDCPRCCGAGCSVTVACTNKAESSAKSDDCGCGQRSSNGGGLCTAYLACGD